MINILRPGNGDCYSRAYYLRPITTARCFLFFYINWNSILFHFRGSYQSVFKRSKSSLEHAVLQMTNWFAGDQIRNVASIGGNIMTSSPISDLNQIWLALKCELEFCHMENGKLVTTSHNIADGFFTGYRKNIVKPRNWLKCCSLAPLACFFLNAVLWSK